MGSVFPKTRGGGDPDSLNVTINDTTQNLQVNGSMVVDSSLTVKDSVIMEDNLHIYEKLQLEKDAHLKKDVYVGNEIKVEKDAHLQKDAYIGNEIKVEGDAYLLGNAFLMKKLVVPNLETLQDYDLSYILFSKEDGVVEKKLVFDVLAEIYKNPCKTDLNGDVPSPTWQNGLNKIFTPCPNVNVGIGTSNPEHKLDVRGRGYFSNGVRIGTITPSAEIIPNQALLEIETTSNTAPFIRFSHKTGTNTPQTRFRVENDGKVYCTSVWVSWPDSIPVPDYVFGSNYKLMPLKDLKTFVFKNNHLPNIPSEQEIKKDGFNIEQMQMQLLEKIEELTLYLIEIDEKNDELIKQNEIFKNEIESLKNSLPNK